MVSHRIDQWYRNEQQKRQVAETQVVQLKSTVSRLKSDVEELMPYKDKAERIPELEMELETVKAELQEEKNCTQSLLCQIEALKSIILDLAGAFAAKFRGVLDFIRDLVRKKEPRLAKQIVPRADIAADIDAYIARAERNRTQAKRHSSDWER